MNSTDWQQSYVEIINNQTQKAMWEIKNVIDCIPDDMWNKSFCEMPLYKHIYHTLHSLDMWFINPYYDYNEPNIHIDGLNNLDIITEKYIFRDEINIYYENIKSKISSYLLELKDEDLLKYPEKSKYTRFTLIMAQHRHLHSHMGMLMGFIIQSTGNWPTVLGLERDIPKGQYNKFC